MLPSWLYHAHYPLWKVNSYNPKMDRGIKREECCAKMKLRRNQYKSWVVPLQSPLDFCLASKALVAKFRELRPSLALCLLLPIAIAVCLRDLVRLWPREQRNTSYLCVGCSTDSAVCKGKAWYLCGGSASAHVHWLFKSDGACQWHYPSQLGLESSSVFFLLMNPFISALTASPCAP